MKPEKKHGAVPVSRVRLRSAEACCAARGSGQVLEALRREVNARGLEDEVQVTACSSLGLCEHGPNLVIYPEGLWYSGVTPADVPEIVRSHFQEDSPVERLRPLR